MKTELRSQVSGPRRASGWTWVLVFPSAFCLLPSAFCLTAASPAATDIRGIVPPQPIFVGADLGWLAVAVLCLLLAGFILWEFLRPTRKPPAPPPNPREVAARRLRELEARMEHLDARDFGAAVCDVLRAYIGGEFGLNAERQTSPEFLASIADNRAFSVREHHVLADFLEACDLLKFGRADATSDRKRHLLAQAAEFLEHTSHPPTPPPLPGQPEAATPRNAGAGVL